MSGGHGGNGSWIPQRSKRLKFRCSVTEQMKGATPFKPEAVLHRSTSVRIYPLSEQKTRIDLQALALDEGEIYLISAKGCRR
jgi:hypothetical protein